MKFAICNEMFEGWDVGDVFRYAAEVGFDGVEVAPFTIAESVTDISATQRSDIRKQASDAGVDVVGLHWLLISPKGLYITHVDQDVRTKTIDYFKELINCTADVGGNRMILGSPKQRDVMDGVTYEQAWDYAQTFLREITPTAEERDVVLCFEPLAPVETNFIQTADEAIKLVEPIGSPNVQIILDVKAMSSEARSIPEIIHSSRNWVKHFHANDVNLQGPGFGDVDFVPIAEALHEIDFQDWVSVEVFDFSIDPKETATKSIAYLRETFGVSR